MSLREALGSEVLVHFAVDVPPVVTEDTKELVADAGVPVEELEARASAGGSTFVARLDPRTKATELETLDIGVDTSRLHFFEPETGLGIYD